MKLVEGQWYKIKIRQRGEKKSMVTRTIHMRLIKEYTKHAQFEDRLGLRRSFVTADCEKIARGEVLEG